MSGDGLIARFDSSVINFFQKITNGLAGVFGINNFLQARLVSLLGMIFGVMYTISPFLFIGEILPYIFVIGVSIAAERLVQKRYNAKNPLRVTLFEYRVASLYLCSLFIYNSLSKYMEFQHVYFLFQFIDSVLYLISLYLVACDPPSNMGSGFRKWLNNLFKSKQTSYQGV